MHAWLLHVQYKENYRKCILRSHLQTKQRALSIMKLSTVAVALALAVSARAADVPSLTPENYDELTAGKVRWKDCNNNVHIACWYSLYGEGQWPWIMTNLHVPWHLSIDCVPQVLRTMVSEVLIIDARNLLQGRTVVIADLSFLGFSSALAKIPFPPHPQISFPVRFESTFILSIVS